MQTYFEILEKKALEIRKQVLKMIYTSGSGHTGGSLSSVDILVALYFNAMHIDSGEPEMPHRDRFILSKGHSVESLYCVLAKRGFFDNKILESYGRFNSILAGHPTKKVPGVELNSGSLGHGLSVGTGMALAGKKDNGPYRVFVLMGDGEQGEGSINEAAMSAAHYQLDNLIAIIDRNRLQISGTTEEIMQLEDLAMRWESLGWNVQNANGHNMEELCNYFKAIPVEKGKPHLLIANTIKGKGVSFIENNYKWHHKVPSKQEFETAIEELSATK